MDSVASELNSVIASVRKLQLIPSVYIYTVTPKGTGISAADVDQYNLHFAYSPGHSRDIYVTLDSEDDLTGDFDVAWGKYKATRNLEKKDESREETKSNPGSSQMHVFQHGADVTGLHFTPDGNLLLSSGFDGTAKAWSVSSFQLVESYSGSSGVVSDIHSNTNSTYFATSLRFDRQNQGCISAAALYNFEKKDPVSTLKGHTDDVECVRFHPNGLYIATASCDKTIKLWCTRTSKEVRNMQAEDSFEGYPRKLSFSPDGKYLASAYSDSVKIWDLASGRVLKCLDIPNSSPNILNLCYDPFGNILATGGSDKKLQLWNMKSDSSESSDIKPKGELLKSDNLDKTVYCIKYTSGFFTSVTA